MELISDNTRRPVVYSANFGEGEPVRPLLVKQTLKTVLFTDKQIDYLEGWDRIITVDSAELAETPRKAARRLKLQSHRVFPFAPWSVWMDSTHIPCVDLRCLGDFLKLSDIACFAHPLRTTARLEAVACKELQLDDEDAINAAIAYFDSTGFSDAYGLYGTACVVRRHTRQVVAMNELWWYACNRWTHRDQIVLPWVIWMLNMTPACLVGKPRDHAAAKGTTTRPNPYFDVTVW